MFGYLIASQELLSQEEYDRYRACYCGLCHSLKLRHGQLSRLTLNYDMTFLVMLLSSLYEPEELAGENVCLVHPKAPRQWWRSQVSDYAADMNLALAYLKCLDDWQDDGNIAARAQAALLKSAYDKVCIQYPRQCAAIEQAMEQLHEIEQSKAEAADEAADCFGSLMGEVLVFKEDRWSDTLRSMGRELGRFIYVMDACMDLDSDTLHNRYNPFRRYYRLPDNQQRFRDILKMILGQCLMSFDRLPLVQDVNILKNILCSGLWLQFNKKYSDKKEPSDDSGSV